MTPSALSVTDATFQTLPAVAPERLGPRRAFSICRALGPLARWWLRPEVLARACAYDGGYPGLTSPELPPLSRLPGACRIVYAVPADTPHSLLRPAFLLPVRWVSGELHSPHLPKGLEELADSVARSVGLDGWGLRMCDEAGLAGVDLSGLGSLRHDSGWASLAGGLIVAAGGGEPRPEVWATGCWDHRGGVAEVDGLGEKVSLAREWRAEWFFAPAANVRTFAGETGSVRLRELRQGLSSPGESLAEYLDSLDAPPPIPGPDDKGALNRAVAYYLRQRRPDPSYYRSHLLPAVCESCRLQVRQKFRGIPPADLVTVVSESPETSVISAWSVSAARCLLLYTDTDSIKANAARCREDLERSGVRVTERTFEDQEDLGPVFGAAVAGFRRGSNRVIFDLKPGTKKMTLALYRVAGEGDWLFFFDTLYDKGRPVPGTETVALWPAAAPSGSNSFSVPHSGVSGLTRPD